MWIPKKDFKEIRQLYNEFIEIYGPGYDPEILDYIKYCFFKCIGKTDAPSTVMQIYNELGICKEEDSIYYAHLNNIKKLFDINCNILDVGSGCLPFFGNILACEQLKLGNGTITLYDPLLIYEQGKHSNMTLHRRKFTSNIDISKFDLITGLYPCEVTETILEKTCQARKNFYIAMCGCGHFDFIDFMIPHSANMYQNIVIDRTKRWLEKYDNGDLCIDYMDDKYGLPFPVLYNKR